MKIRNPHLTALLTLALSCTDVSIVFADAPLELIKKTVERVTRVLRCEELRGGPIRENYRHRRHEQEREQRA